MPRMRLRWVLATELRDDQIAVNGLFPGPVSTAAINADAADGEAGRRRWAPVGEWYKDPAEVAACTFRRGAAPLA